jgi:SAM-dependent methyltransferase
MDYNSMVRVFIMTPTSGSLYDQVLYESHAVADAHPGRMAALAVLFGMTPAPVESCRVLELGCGDGAHLTPLALAFPRSRFAGIDLARKPIEAARDLAGRLDLHNIEFHHRDLEDLHADFGEFDYIIAHGLYSWIPAPARDRLLAVCQAHLAPAGVAFISYNILPGGHLRGMLRDILLYHTRGMAEPEKKIERAFEFLRFMAGAGLRSAALKQEVQDTLSFHPAALFHDDMAEVNQPVYFHEFVEHARGHRLQFLAEAEFNSLDYSGPSDDVAQTLRAIAAGDRIQEQQYLDFLRCRRFRQTLLCHDGIPLNAAPDPRRIAQLHVAASVRPVSDHSDLGGDTEEEFESAEGQKVRTNLPMAKTTLSSLSRRWPLPVPFPELAAEIQSLLPPAADTSEALAGLLLRLCASGLVELQAAPPCFTIEVSERPRAFALARLQAQTGTRVTTLRLGTVELQDDMVRRLLLLLDGSRDLKRILAELGVERPDLDRNLEALARMALLEPQKPDSGVY